MSLKHTIGKEGKAVLLGNEAIARGALEAGLAVAAAYPGTPSTEIVEALSSVARDVGIYVEWSVNEKVAFEVAYAAATAGSRALVAMKHVGLNVAADPLMSSAYTGVEESLVIVSADDPSMWSSQNEQDNRIYGLHAYIPVLEPGSPSEAKDLTVYAFELSSKMKHPVILRSTTRISHTRVVVELKPLRKPVRRGTYEKNPSRYVLIPAHARRLRLELLERWKRIEDELASCPFNRVEGAKDSKVAVLASGISYAYVREALEDLGVLDEVKLIKVSSPVPLPRKFVLEALQGVERLLVVEELEPVVEMQVRSIVQAERLGIEIVGKELVGYPYEMTMARALRAISSFLGIEGLKLEPAATSEEVSKLVFPRPPQLCPGCPYRPLYYALRRVADRIVAQKGRDKEPIFCGDIGCYTLGLNPPFNAQDTCIEMGGSIGLANGFARSVDGRVPIAIIGDSTFYHAGMPPLLNAVFNKNPLLVIVLDNRVTAMTGHQPSPSTGVTAMGERTRVVPAEDIAKAMGLEFIKVVDPFSVEDAERVIQEAIEYVEKERKPAMIVSRRLCALVAVRNARRKGIPIPRYVVDESACRGCGLCYTKFACPAIRPRDPGKDRRAVIDPELCTGCGVCASICPFKAIKPVSEAEARRFLIEVWR